MLPLLLSLALTQAPKADAFPLPSPGDAGVPIPSALARVVAEAWGVLEVELPLITTEAPEKRWARALSGAPKSVTVLVSRGYLVPPEPLELPRFQPIRSCLFRTNDKLTVRVLLVLTGNPPQVTPFPLATFGLGLDSTPGYLDLRAALREAFHWTDQRAVPEAERWQAQRAALEGENPVLRHLAVEFLTQRGATDVIDRVWGPPGSPGRVELESRSRIAPDCKTKK